MIDDNYFKALEAEIQATAKGAEAAQQKERLLETLKEYRGEDKIESSHDIAARLKEGDAIPTHSTGIPKLDELLRGGMRPGQLVVLSAITKHGKTEFCIYLTGKMKELNPLWFSYEDGAEELVERFMDRGADIPLFYTPAALTQRKVSWIEERIVESIVKFGTKLVFIDNLHYLIPRGENQSSEIGVVTKSLKDLASKWDVIIVLVTHLRKTQLDKVPTLDDIRDSSFIAQDASTVMFLWRQTVVENNSVTITNNTMLSVQAARRGKPGNIKLVFNGTDFYEHDWEQAISTFNDF